MSIKRQSAITIYRGIATADGPSGGWCPRSRTHGLAVAVRSPRSGMNGAPRTGWTRMRLNHRLQRFCEPRIGLSGSGSDSGYFAQNRSDRTGNWPLITLGRCWCHLLPPNRSGVETQPATHGSRGPVRIVGPAHAGSAHRRFGTSLVRHIVGPGATHRLRPSVLRSAHHDSPRRRPCSPGLRNLRSRAPTCPVVASRST